MAAEIEIVGLFSWELWWQDCNHVLERKSSWEKSRKAFPFRGECCPSGFLHA